MALNNTELRVVASCRDCGEVGFVTVGESQLSDREGTPTKLIAEQLSPATSVLGSTTLQLNITLTLIGDIKSDADEDRHSPVLLEIDKAIEAEEQEVFCSDREDQVHQQRYVNLSTLFSRRFIHTKEVGDLRQAIFCIERSIDMAMKEALVDSVGPPNTYQAELAERFSTLGDLFGQCFQVTSDPSDLGGSIEAHQQAVDTTPGTDAASLPARLNNFSNALQRRFDIDHDAENLQTAVGRLKEAVALTPAHHGNLPTLLTNLGSALLRRFYAGKNLEDLREAIAHQHRAVELCKSGHPDHHYRVSKLGLLYQRRFEHSHSMDDIAQALHFKRMAADMAEVEGTQEHSNEHSAALHSLAYAFHVKFQETSNLDDLEEAISIQRRSVQLTPPSSSRIISRLTYLSSLCNRRFLKTQRPEHISDAIRVQRDVVDHAMLSTDKSSLSNHLETLGRWLGHRYKFSQNATDLEQAVLSHRRAVECCPSNPQYLSTLSQSLRLQFGCSQKLEHIEEAISLAREAISLTPEDEQSAQVRRMYELTWALHGKLEGNILVQIEDVDEAVANSLRCVALTQPNDRDEEDRPVLPPRLMYLGAALQHRYKLTRRIADLQEAIVAHEKAVALTPEFDRNLPVMLNNLCIALERQYEATGDGGCIDRVIAMRRQMVNEEERKRPQSPDLPGWVGGLANALHLRFRRSGLASDIDDAVANHTRAIAMSSPTEPHLPSMFTNFANALRSRAELNTSVEDIDQALDCLEKARALTPNSHHLDRSSQYLALGGAHQVRFRYGHDPTDIILSIEYLRESVKLLSPQTPVSSSSLATLRQNARLAIPLDTLGGSLQLRFEREGDLSDIQEAISVKQKVVGMTPQDHADYPSHLANLGNSFLYRFGRTKDKSDLEEAIEYQEAAIRRTPSDHPQLPARMSNLGLSLRTLAKLTRQLPDFDKATAGLKTAIALEAVVRNPSLHSHITDALGTVSHERFEVSNSLEDIKEAISFRRKAVSLLTESDTSPSLYQYLNNLGASLHILFRRTGEITHLDEAIAVLQRALDSIPESSAQTFLRLRLRTNLADTQATRYSFSKEIHYGRECASNWQEVALNRRLSPWTRINIAKRLAKLTKRFDRGGCLFAYKLCIQLISVISGLEQTIQSRHSALASISNITLEAAAVAVEIGVAELAMEWLEQGRCLVWTQLNSLRTPVDSLRSVNPELADRLTHLSPLLEKMGSRNIHISPTPESESGPLDYTGSSLGLDMETERKILLQDDVVSHVNLAQEWEWVLTQVRAMDGFEDFFKPPPVEEWFDRIPANGVVVVIVIHQTRCDVLVLQPGATKPLHLHLQELTYDMVEEWRTSLHRSLVTEGVRMRGYDGTGSGGGDPVRPVDNVNEPDDRVIRPMRRAGGSSSVLEHVLKQLWTRIAKPIVDTLTLKASKDRVPEQRIWWCPTGSLSFLPLHAAGIYGRPDAVGISDYAVSSYIPTLSSFLECLKSNPGSDTPSKAPAERGVLLIGEHNAPGLPAIPGAKTEVKAIKTQLTSRGIPTMTLGGETDNMAVIEAGVSNMNKYTCVHLACHAKQDTNEPLRSGFHLHDGRLELSKIIQANMTNADLAFLSACETSTGDEKLSEEAVHLAAGMLAAGYRGVVGTMWSIKDKYASEIAESFYDDLLTRSAAAGTPDIDGRHAGQSLHHAITHGIRKKLGNTPESLLVWVPYVHFGL